MNESETQLIERARHEPEAFGRLYETYVNRIYAYIYYRTGSVRDAEDLTARVFYRALARIAEYDQRGAPFAAWLYRIAHNLVANFHRDRSRHGEAPLDILRLAPSDHEAPPQAVLRTEEEGELLTAIRRLPADRQQILILKFVQEMSNREIGQVLGKSESAIKSLYHRTLLELRQDMEHTQDVENG